MTSFRFSTAKVLHIDLKLRVISSYFGEFRFLKKKKRTDIVCVRYAFRPKTLDGNKAVVTCGQGAAVKCAGMAA